MFRPGRVETPRPGPEKLGSVRTDPDLIGLLFTLIYRATSHRQERAQTPGCLGATTAVKGLITPSRQASAPRQRLGLAQWMRPSYPVGLPGVHGGGSQTMALIPRPQLRRHSQRRWDPLRRRRRQQQRGHDGAGANGSTQNRSSRPRRPIRLVLAELVTTGPGGGKGS